MKLAVLLAAVALVAARPEELESGLRVVRFDASEGPSGAETPLAFNRSPAELRLNSSEPQYHAAVGVAEAARVRAAERGERPATRIVGGLGSYVGEHPFFVTSIKPIAIATGSATYEGYRAEAIGFGRTYDSAPITDAASLRDVFVTVISNIACANYYGSIIDSAIICTEGAGGRNPCGGDSGGPLILYSSGGSDVLIGIINFHPAAGCQSGAPGGYVRVSYHAPWLIANA